MKATRKFPIFLLLAGVALMAFYQWGLNTHSGREAFPEMASTIPFLAGVAGCWRDGQWPCLGGGPLETPEGASG